MNIYKMTRLARIGYDEYSGFVIAADCTAECLDLVVEACGVYYASEDYEYVLISDTTNITDAQIILSDFHAG